MKQSKSTQMKNAYRSYQLSSNTSLWDVYSSWSKEKQEAFEYCKKLCADYDGKGLKIVSANGWMFTCGFMCEIDGKKAFVFITKSANRYMYI